MADERKRTDLFRKKSIVEASSPEDLEGYITTAKPSMWLLFLSVIFMLIGLLVWTVFGTLYSSMEAGCRVDGNKAEIFIGEGDYEKLREESYIELNGEKYTVFSVAGPGLADEESDDFLLRAAGIKDDEWYYTLFFSTDLHDGEYKSKVIYQKISPITFIIN